MSFRDTPPREWLPAEVIASRPEVERRLIDQILGARETPTLLELQSGVDFVKEGYLATTVYVVLAGELVVNVDGQDVAHLGRGSVFGELAILGNRQRTATLTSAAPTTIASVSEYAVDRDDLRELAATR